MLWTTFNKFQQITVPFKIISIYYAPPPFFIVLYIAKLLNSAILRMYHYKYTITLSKTLSEFIILLLAKRELSFPTENVCLFKTRILVSSCECVKTLDLIQIYKTFVLINNNTIFISNPTL